VARDVPPEDRKFYTVQRVTRNHVFRDARRSDHCHDCGAAAAVSRKHPMLQFAILKFFSPFRWLSGARPLHDGNELSGRHGGSSAVMMSVKITRP
jgi:hypothetical protein